MTTWDRQDKPLAREFRAFAKVVAQLDLEGVRPAPADGGVIVPYEWSKPHGDMSKSGLTGPASIPYVSNSDNEAVPGKSQREGGSENSWLMGSLLNTFILGRRSGLAFDFPREQQDWETRPMVLLPSPLTSTGSVFLNHVRSDFYGRARKYVENGGLLYASVAADAAIPGMVELFGARLVDWNQAQDVTLKMVAPLGSLKAGDTLHFAMPGGGARSWGSLLEVEGGQVLAVDQDGNPALVTHAVGKGRTLLAAYPFETWLASAPGVYEREPNAHRFYQAIREWSGLRPLFSTDQPQVEVASLNAEHSGYAVVVNHGSKAAKVKVSSSRPLHSLRWITPEGPRPLKIQDGAWEMEVGAFDGAVVEWK